MLVEVKNIGEYCILGEFIDDVVGEVFDKMVKLMGLDYLGGLLLVKLVEKGILGCFKFFCFMMDRLGFDMSFFGLKIFIVNIIVVNGDDEQICVDIVYVF